MECGRTTMDNGDGLANDGWRVQCRGKFGGQGNSPPYLEFPWNYDLIFCQEIGNRLTGLHISVTQIQLGAEGIELERSIIG
ncbi:MAG: hypothetical protein PVG65_04655 [Candidatus Thorarchaeota archaeon]